MTSEIRDPETSKDLDTGYFHSPENSGMTHLQFAVDTSELCSGVIHAFIFIS
jgi:hypothetical protein